MKIGFFGGTFNPPTNAHTNLAKKVLNECNLDEIIFIPMGDLYEKKDLAKAEHRYKMLELACKDVPGLKVSDLEIKVNKKLKAIDAFRLIENTYLDIDRYFIMGADNFINIMKWKNGKDLISNYNYIILNREQINLENYINKSEELKTNMSHIKIIENIEHRSISSTQFRNLLIEHEEKAKDIVTKDVFDYIIKNDIY